jgi:hypothetical protein
VRALTKLGAVRTGLRRDVFSDPSSRDHTRSWRWLLATSVATLLTAAQLGRMWASGPLHSIWAEDGSQWLTSATTRGLGTSLRSPYDGYLQTSSRLLGELVSRLPVGMFAVGMAVAGSLLVSGCALVVWVTSATHVRSSALRAVLAGSLVLAPTAGVEMYANVTNAIWLELYTCFWLVLWRPGRARTAGLGALGLCLAALSTAATVFLLPVWLARLAAARDRRDAILLAGLPLGLAIQASPLALPGRAQPPAHWNWDLLPAYAQRVVAASALGDRVAGTAWTHIGGPVDVIAGTAFLGAVVYGAARASPRARVVGGLAIGVSLLSFFGAGYERAAGPHLIWSAGTDPTDLTRYSVVPSLLLIAAAIVFIDDRAQRGVRASGTVIAWALAVAVVSFPIGDRALRGTPVYSQALRAARTHCTGTSGVRRVNVSPPYFTPMRLPCRLLEQG